MSSLPISIQDCVRLGSYCQNHMCSRPLLVMLNSISDVTKILSGNGKLHSSKGSPIYIQRDLSKEEYAQYKTLLSERRLLIDRGLNSKSINVSEAIKGL